MVQEIVQEVMAKMQIADAPAEKQHGVFKDMNDAIEAAKKSQEIADNCTILYGGSCNASNAKELFAKPNVDGGLIGGASLAVDKFMPIIEAFN